MLALLFATSGPTLALIYWQRSIQYHFTVVGIDAELLQLGWVAYTSKTVATSLDVDNRVSLTIYAENFYNVWLNLTWSSAAEDLVVDATGQYYLVYEDGGGLWHYEAQGDSFSIMGYNVVDKTRMMWSPSTKTKPAGGLLMITFGFDTELVTIAGEYTVELLFQMGFE